MVTDETFFAWLDGELEGEEAARVAAEVAADPALSGRAEQHRAMQTRLKGAFDGLLAAPVPGPLAAAVRSDPQISDFAEVKRAREQRQWNGLPQWAALAASVAVGIFIGTMVPRQSSAPVALEDGKVYAAAALGDALDTQLASAPAGEVRIGVTFRDQSGAICRSFTEAAASGLACRDGQRWRLRGLFGAPEGQGGQFRMAGGVDPNLAALVDSSISGEPFDAAAEKAAKDRGWR
jgi:hypothetical protein